MVNQLAPDSLKDLMVSMHCAEASEDANGRQNGNEDGDLRPSEENPTQLLREVNQLGPDSETVVLAQCIETSEDACLVQSSYEADPSEENKAALPQQDPGLIPNQLDQDSDLMESKEPTRDGLITSSDEQKPTKRPLESLHEGTLDLQNPISTENKQAICNDMQINEDGLLAESDEQQPTKKIRLVSPDRGKVDGSES